MFILCILVLGQIVLIIIALFVLKRLLSKELIGVALENFNACKASADIKAIRVISAYPLPEDLKTTLQAIGQRKFAEAKFIFEENPMLKGGLVINVGEQHLDFSLATRLRQLWS